MRMSTALTWSQSRSTSARRAGALALHHRNVLVKAACHGAHAPLRGVHVLHQNLLVSAQEDAQDPEDVHCPNVV